MNAQKPEKLYDRRNKIVARSFYRQLRSEGFTPEQIITLSTTLLDLVTDDLQKQISPVAK
jgi:hypothetical protein